MSGMLNRMVEAMHTAVAADSGTMEDVARAALLAIREPDEAFMLKLYPDPTIETADRGRAAGERSRRAGKLQVARLVDAILAEGASE